MKIKEYLEINKLTYRAFAERIGVSHACISHFLNGRNKTLTLAVIQKIVKGTHNRITFEDLLEEVKIAQERELQKKD